MNKNGSVPADTVPPSGHILAGEEGNKKWTRRYWIRKLKLTLIHDDYAGIVKDVEKRIAKLATTLSLDLHDTALELLLSGLEKKEQELLRLEQELGRPVLDAEHKQLISVWEETSKIEQEKKIVDDLLPIYKYRGKEGFEEWCELHGFDADQFYALHKEGISKLSRSKRFKLWLEEIMKDASGPVPVLNVKERAFKDKIVENESDWQALEKHAQRMEITNRPYGYWWKE